MQTLLHRCYTAWYLNLQDDYCNYMLFYGYFQEQEAKDHLSQFSLDFP